MFPIRDHNPSGRTPYVTYALMAANIAIFLSYWPLFDQPRALNAFFVEWAMIPARVMHADAYGSLVSSMFLHGGWMHLAGNMLFLWIFGDNLEDEMGHLAYLGFYLLCGVGSALAQVASAPYSLVPTVGASGAIAGVMGGYLLLFPKARVDILIIFVVFFRILPIPAWIMLGLWFAFQVFGGLSMPTTSGGVAYWAHAGGFVLGAVLTVPLLLRRGGVQFWSRTDGHPPHPAATYQYAQTRIPKVRRK
ncbi:rhomboid family intramembrane serine protease [Pelagivirga sediminicola]|uniref:Rhomboid family intramembrane serine protease n=1 Tax=Pelagivirga sediminicola TaxID=2170575 RepID=A0A2T7G4J6_9RHOB|nr:rhomboid family intramembrane serine protease [Pelagivirga sediminicola]PVA09327.1 rhomboid family intramembrane serine protease [Pelagivirga sediminicola]